MKHIFCHLQSIQTLLNEKLIYIEVTNMLTQISSFTDSHTIFKTQRKIDKYDKKTCQINTRRILAIIFSSQWKVSNYTCSFTTFCSQ